MSEPSAVLPSAKAYGALPWAGYLLGFGLGGFFDGVLLHQILQWHHLLSAVGGGWSDLRMQVLADGLFHAVMYVIAAGGLALLWRSRKAFARIGGGRLLAASALIGFGAWHATDALLSHWLLGIHRIRMDSANPLAWDLAWLAAFGLAPLAFGVLLRRRGGGGTGRTPQAAALAVFVLAAGVAAGLPPAGSPAVVVFRAGVTDGEAMAALAALDGRVAWSEGGVWAVELPEGRSAWGLYRRGALFVGAGPTGSCAVRLAAI